MPSVIPELDELETISDYTPADDAEQKRGMRVGKRIDAMLEARAPYESAMERGLLLYDGIFLLNPKNKTNLTNDNVISPFARMFVEAKTAEEVKAQSEYVFSAVESSDDQWKVDLLKEINVHVRRVTHQTTKRHQMIRMKNICGVSIARVGYRRVMGMRKIRIEGDENGEILKWKEKPVPVYDDLFMDVVSPLNFAIDPNATSMNDAMDCVQFHYENFENFWEVYHNDPKFKNTDKVKPGQHGRYGEKGFAAGHYRSYAAQENMVLIAEYFNKTRDEWVVYANGIEIYFGPLPDDHKELPFISYHNAPSFASGFIEATATTAEGEDVSTAPSVRAEETFWTQGDPQVIMDLIVLRTQHGRAAHRAMKRSSQVIIATDGNFSLPADQKWMDGAQAKGAMGKIQVLPLGVANPGNWEWANNDLYNQMRLSIGIDPSNLADTKQKTATEAEIQWETSMRRLDAGIQFNEENGDVRLGMLVHKVVQQRYTKPEIVRLTGAESPDEIGRFDEIEKDPETGVPLYGKRWRRIKSSINLTENQRGGKMKMSKDDSGVSSFIARPEYIRTSDIDIAVDSGRKAARIQAIESEKSMRALDLYTKLIALAQVDPMTGKSLIDKNDLPNVKALVRRWMRSLDMNPETDIGQGKDTKSETEKGIEDYQDASSKRQPLNAIPSAVNAAS